MKTQKKKFVVIAASLLFVLFLCVAAFFFLFRGLPISDTVNDILAKKGIKKSKILYLYEEKSEDELEHLYEGHISEKNDKIFLKKFSEKCRFYIDEDEAQEHGEDAIKEYLIVGVIDEIQKSAAYDEESFVEFCSMSGYDSTIEDAKTFYPWLRNKAVNHFILRYIYDIGYEFHFDENDDYLLEVYECSNIDDIAANKAQKYILSTDNQRKLFQKIDKNMFFGDSCYESGNQLYDVVLQYTDSKHKIQLMIDTKNGYITKNSEDGLIKAKLSDEVEEMINQIKSNG